MYNRFFFITTYDNITGKVLSSILNEHPDIDCGTSYPDPFLPKGILYNAEPADSTVDKFIEFNRNPEKLFNGNSQRYSSFELHNKSLVEKTSQAFNKADILLSPKQRIDFIMHSWTLLSGDVNQTTAFIDQRLYTIRRQGHCLINNYLFDYFYEYIRNIMMNENIADVTVLKNRLFMYALAKTITHDTADIPAQGKKFKFEELLSNKDEFVKFIKYLTNDNADISAEFSQNLALKLDEHQTAINNMSFHEWEPWQVKLLDRLMNAKLITIYYPHIDKSLAALYKDAGYHFVDSNKTTNKPLYSKLISIQLNSNRPSQLAAYFDNIEETADHPEEVEILVNIDIGNQAMKTLIEAEIPQRKFTLKYIETERPASFCDLWKPINDLFEITDPDSYFLVNISDEMLFATQGWDTVLKKYIGFFPDHIFRLRASRNKIRNYFDRWECSFAQDSIPITTKRWVDIGGNWNPCFGPDSFQQLIAFYLAKEGMFSNSNYLRDVPMLEIKFAGDVPALGIDATKSWRHSKDHILAMQICQSYPMQLEARRRAILLKANIIAHSNQLQNCGIMDLKARKQINLYDSSTKVLLKKMDYSVSRLGITLTNQWRKLAFFNYFGDGPEKSNLIKSFFRYLAAKYIWALNLRKIIRRVKTFEFSKLSILKKVYKVNRIKSKLKSFYLPHTLKEELIRLRELNTNLNLKFEKLQNVLIDNTIKPLQFSKSDLKDKQVEKIES